MSIFDKLKLQIPATMQGLAVFQVAIPQRMRAGDERVPYALAICPQFDPPGFAVFTCDEQWNSELLATFATYQEAVLAVDGVAGHGAQWLYPDYTEIRFFGSLRKWYVFAVVVGIVCLDQVRGPFQDYGLLRGLGFLANLAILFTWLAIAVLVSYISGNCGGWWRGLWHWVLLFFLTLTVGVGPLVVPSLVMGDVERRKRQELAELSIGESG